MPVGAALALVTALVAVATLAGLVWRARTGRVGAGRGDLISPADLDTAASFGRQATLLQFSTEFCARCPSTRRVLGQLASESDGVEHVDIDLTNRPDLASRFSVLSTPTVLLLDGRGRVRGRIVGAPRPAELRQRLTDLLEGDTHDRAA